MEINLGPLLGIEADYHYTVCFLSEIKFSKNKLKLVLDKQGDDQESAHIFESCIKLQSHYFYRFSFELPQQNTAYSVAYSLTFAGEPLTDLHRRNFWEFEVPGRNSMPKIGFSSCNGDSKKHPSKIKKKEFIMWHKMKQNHLQPGQRFHLLLMGGDQVYADSIWDEIQTLDKLKTRFFTKTWKLTTDAVVNFKPNSAQVNSFVGELKAFYEQLYIDSWSDENMSFMLASVPTVMMWDDHDIVDGWGSYPPRLQQSPIFKHIFPVARDYFEIFQTRTSENACRIAKTHFSMHLSFRNLEIVVLDNRTFRTTNRIMNKSQYKDLQMVLNRKLFNSIPDVIKEERILCFVVPVPIAHLKYATLIQNALTGIFKNNFRHSMNDDALDHWDHQNHEDEQKKLLDALFDAGVKHNAKYVCVVSGDVHTAGAATITNMRTQHKITQLISSGMVHVAPNWWQLGVVRLVTSPISEIAGYSLNLKNFGNFKKHTINLRNFGILTKANHSGVVASLEMEQRANMAHRTLNKFRQ